MCVYAGYPVNIGVDFLRLRRGKMKLANAYSCGGRVATSIRMVGLTSDHLGHGQNHTDDHHGASEHDANNGWDRPPAPLAQLHIAQRWEDICQRTRARRANELEHRS